VWKLQDWSGSCEIVLEVARLVWKLRDWSGSCEIGLEVNAKKIKYTLVSGEENAGKYRDMKTGNIYFEFQTFGNNHKKTETAFT
jgi:hypothetical protein